MTNKFEIKVINEIDDQILSLATEFRKNLKPEDCIERIKIAKLENQYELIGCYHNNILTGFAGYRFITDLLHGRHIYIDDLMTHQEYRRQGVAIQLINYIEQIAVAQNIGVIRLCTGIDQYDNHSFYKNRGYQQRAVVYKKYDFSQ